MYCRTAPYYNGLSAAYRYDGEQLLLAGSEEGVYTADFNVTATRIFRQTAISGGMFICTPYSKHILAHPYIDICKV